MNREYNFKIHLDTERDSDVIRMIEELNKKNKLPKTVEKAIKRYCRNIGEDTDNIEERSVSLRINEIKNSIDTLWKECERLEVLVKIEDAICKQERVENLTVAEFLIERQFKRLLDELGINRNEFERDKERSVEYIRELADEALETVCDTKLFREIVGIVESKTSVSVRDTNKYKDEQNVIAENKNIARDTVKEENKVNDIKTEKSENKSSSEEESDALKEALYMLGL